MASAVTSKTILVMLMLTLQMGNIECYPRKRATGGVPHILQDLFEEGHKTQTSEMQLVANSTLLTTSTMSYIASLLERQSEQFQKMVVSLNTLTKGLHLTAGDCSDVATQGPYSSGTYVITPWDDSGYKGAFKVYCDMETAGGGWTVFQKRFNGSVDFYRDWEDYENGFGNLDGEYWLGLTKLYRLTRSRLSWQLRVELEDFDGNTAYAQYDDFSIGDESTGFQLTVGAFNGTAGDSMVYHNDGPFSTRDKDSDESSINCAVDRGGAWWYKSCAYSNLNGPYLGSPVVNWKGLIWYYWKNSEVTLKKSEMKIRPTE